MSNFVITKNALNRVVLTLSERSQLTNPYYLITLKNKFSVSEVVTSLSVQDTAPSNMRYNLLEITEKSAPNPLSGEVHLLEGEWSYKVYESLVQTLHVADTTGRILQQGLIIVE